MSEQMETNEQTIQKRQIAMIVAVDELLKGTYVSQEGYLPDYVQVSWGERVSRVQVIGTVVDKNDRQLILDDGTGTIPLRFFEPVYRFDDTNIGTIVSVVGKVREYSGERYIILESIQFGDTELLLFRQKQMELFTSFREHLKNNHVEEELDDVSQELDKDLGEDTSLSLVDTIDEKDTGDGVTIQSLVDEFGSDTQSQVDKLLLTGDIFEIRPGIVKVLK